MAALAGVLSCLIVATASAEGPPADPDDDAGAGESARRGGLSSDPEDPQNLLPDIQERRAEKDSLLPVSPLYWLHEGTDCFQKSLSPMGGIELRAHVTHPFPALS